MTVGTWSGGLVKRWHELPEPEPAIDERALLACLCGATLTEPCRTAGGNYTVHADRVIPRRCRCLGILEQGALYCGDQCRQDARRDTYRRREQRTPTRLRRAA